MDFFFFFFGEPQPLRWQLRIMEGHCCFLHQPFEGEHTLLATLILLQGSFAVPNKAKYNFLPAFAPTQETNLPWNNRTTPSISPSSIFSGNNKLRTYPNQVAVRSLMLTTKTIIQHIHSALMISLLP